MFNNKIKFFAISVIAVLIVVFWYFSKTSVPTDTQKISTDTTSQFSVLPAANDLLIAAHSPVLGDSNAPITIVEFLDPECEACSQMSPIVKKLMAEFKGQIRLVIRYMPFHSNSIYAASALEGAREQGKYWEALALLFETQSTWGSHHEPKPELILPYLKNLKLDVKKIESQIKAEKFLSLIEKDKSDGKNLGVTATPTFFVNGEKLYDIGYEPIKEAILKKLAATN